MIDEFKYGQTWKIWPSPLSLSLYSTFKILWKENNIVQDLRISAISPILHYYTVESAD